MNSASVNHTCLGPGSVIYVYLVTGLVDDCDEPCLGASFIGNWVDGDTSFLFFSSPAHHLVEDLTRKRSTLEISDQFCFSYEEWQGGIPKPFETGRLIVVPCWEEVSVGKDRIPIFLDPGVVFGNSLHPTTRTCLKAMVSVWKDHSISRVVDLGTGTGILALAAASLGAEKVLAVDLNPLCVKTARKNVGLNELQGIVDVVQGEAEKFVGAASDLVVANMHYEAISRFLEAGGLNKTKLALLSGLLRSQVRDIKEQLIRGHLEILGEWDYEAIWYTILVENKHWI